MFWFMQHLWYTFQSQKLTSAKKLWSKNEEAAEQEAAEVLSCAFATVLKPCMFGEEK
jgi:hypothetical protein